MIKKPLAYISAAWSGTETENMEAARRYCRAVYEAGFSPICPRLYLPLFIDDAIPREHKDGILNVCFPEMDDMEVLKTLRGLKPMPILILSTSSALADKLQAFKTGADDYLTKPFETEECLARVYALLRRFHELNPLKTRAYSIVAHGDLMMKRDTRQALISGRPLELTYREYELLNLFMSHPERVFTFEQLYEQVWAEPYMGNKNSVVCEMKRLRKKLGDTDPIEAVREVGYRFKKE